ncbi:uncharacterized protein PHALS_04307 [Plasmopara halstedii]|uniref:Uncharacterized protein n=1 Tax=Plasmopara halstedii TaxID=4781 RepID=A0A0P1B160_PLAHL|nr:uncharacterized protein PHALS_04307 [Plasmopara halstedii]CEG47432.1 hypothetical protein PHALS_04307 [Plasmopara halstedii]|eukprot:XP_024583801.1 hypothetical protein PHALS_04307 [Plasmopara halstedii]
MLALPSCMICNFTGAAVVDASLVVGCLLRKLTKELRGHIPDIVARTGLCSW